MSSHPPTRRWALTALVLASMGLVAVTFVAGQATGRKLFKESVVPLPQPTDDESAIAHGMVVNATSLAHKQDKMEVLFAVGMSPENEKKLEALVALGKTVTPDELKQMSASGETVDKLKAWLTQNGFK